MKSNLSIPHTYINKIHTVILIVFRMDPTLTLNFCGCQLFSGSGSMLVWFVFYTWLKTFWRFRFISKWQMGFALIERKK